MSKKQLSITLLIAFFIGALGSISFDHYILPNLATVKGFSGLNKFVTNAPIIINRREEVQLNEGVNVIDLIKQAGNITVSIYGPNDVFLGNGLIVTSDGLIFTSSQVAQKALTFSVITNDGQKFPATLKNKDLISGLAMMTIPSSGLSTAQFDNAVDLQAGQRVIYIGRGNVKFEHMALAGLITQSLVNQVNIRQISSDASVSPDYAGGPIIDLSGHVVGLVLDGSQTIISEDLQAALTKYLAK